eukprot:5133548-Ditylum_brightwellii.AAC.1
MDNSFNSVMFSVAALHYCHKRSNMHGVVQKIRQGVPPCVIQEELRGKRADTAHMTAKLAVLKGDSCANDIIVASCYNTNPSA